MNSTPCTVNWPYCFLPLGMIFPHRFSFVDSGRYTLDTGGLFLALSFLLLLILLLGPQLLTESGITSN